MKLTIEGTKDEIVALVRELGEDTVLLEGAGGLDVTWPPKPTPCCTDPGAAPGSPCPGSGHTSTSGAPDTDSVVVAMNSLAEAHRKPLGGTNTFKEDKLTIRME
jgi:hypothetical protein